MKRTNFRILAISSTLPGSGRRRQLMKAAPRTTSAESAAPKHQASTPPGVWTPVDLSSGFSLSPAGFPHPMRTLNARRWSDPSPHRNPPLRGLGHELATRDVAHHRFSSASGHHRDVPEGQPDRASPSIDNSFRPETTVLDIRHVRVDREAHRAPRLAQHVLLATARLVAMWPANFFLRRQGLHLQSDVN